MGYLVTQVRIGAHKVGITGLEDTFREVQALELSGDDALADEIFARVKAQNYIPSGVEAEYRRAMFMEFRRFCGEQVVDDPQVPEIRIYGGD